MYVRGEVCERRTRAFRGAVREANLHKLIEANSVNLLVPSGGVVDGAAARGVEPVGTVLGQQA